MPPTVPRTVCVLLVEMLLDFSPFFFLVLLLGWQYFDGDLWIEAFELPAVGDSETTAVVNIYR